MNKRHFVLLALLITLAAAALLYWLFFLRTKPLPATIPSNAEGITALTLAKEQDTLRLIRWPHADRGWALIDGTDTAAASPSQVHTLINTLADLRIIAPISSETSNKAHERSCSHGLTVQFKEGKKVTLRYALAAADNDQIRLGVDERPNSSNPHRRYYLAELPGYRTDVLLNIILDPALWRFTGIGVDRPTDIRTVRVTWPKNQQNSFSISTNPTTGEATLYSLNGSTPLPYDTLRMANFLYALTQISYIPTPHDNRLQADCATTPLFQISIATIYNDTLQYQVLPLNAEQKELIRSIPNVAPNDIALLKISTKDARFISLTDWAIAMLSLKSLTVQQVSDK